MSDDEGQLKIDEYANEDIPSAPVNQSSYGGISKFFNVRMESSNLVNESDRQMEPGLNEPGPNEPGPNHPDENMKEEGEIDDEDSTEYSTPNHQPDRLMRRSRTPAGNGLEDPVPMEVTPAEVSSRDDVQDRSAKKEKPAKNGEAGKPPNEDDTKLTPSGRGERKEKMVKKMAVEQSNSGVRSKRASHQLATMAITACLTENDDAAPVMVPPDFIALRTKKPKRDVSTNVVYTRGVESATSTSDMMEQIDLLSAPPGSTLLLEVKVVSRVGGTLFISLRNEGMTGCISDATMPGSAAFTRKRALAQLPTNGTDETRERSSSSASTSNTPAKTFRGTQSGPLHFKRGGSRNASDSRRKLSYATKEEDEDIDGMGEEQPYNKMELDIAEVDLRTLHDCHFEGCEKRFFTYKDLEYHIMHCHKARAVMRESSCTQTYDVMFPKTKFDKGTDVFDLIPFEERMPRPPLRPQRLGSPYSDLSDDGIPPNLPKQPEQHIKKPVAISQPQSKPSINPMANVNSEMPAASALMGIAGNAGSSVEPSAPIIDTKSTGQGGSLQQGVSAQGRNMQSAAGNAPIQSQGPGVLMSPSQRGAPVMPNASQAQPNMSMFMPMPYFMHAGLGGPNPMMGQAGPPGLGISPQAAKAHSRDHKIHELKSKEVNASDRNGPTPKASTASPATSSAPALMNQQRPFGVGMPVMPTPVNPGSNPILQMQLHQMQQMGRLSMAPNPELLQQIAMFQAMNQGPFFPKQ